MFTGIIEACASVEKSLRRPGGGLRLVIASSKIARSCKIGSSVAVDGACLTMVQKSVGRMHFDVVPETLKRTTLGELKTGDRVNLERPLRWNNRMEGHFVLGHIDASGVVRRRREGGGGVDLLIAFPSRLRRYVFEKGSIAVQGVSLTVGRVEKEAFWLHLVPLTLRWTNLSSLRAGDRVNLEADALIKAWRGNLYQ